MLYFAPAITSMAEACLGGLHGRSALLIGPERQRQPYMALLQQMDIKTIYLEETPQRLAALLPLVQLLMHIPDPSPAGNAISPPPITAAAIARGCAGRRAPLVIFDLAETSSIEEVAGLLPAVCLYTPDDLRYPCPDTVQIDPFLIYSVHDSRRDNSVIRSPTRASFKAAG